MMYLNGVETSIRIRDAIKKNGLSVRQVASELGVSKQIVYLWMNPNSSKLPAIDNFIHLASLLGSTVDDFLVLDKECK